ncbi:unnamed protein product [Arabis nemorensis]|uniref:Uncharacterized protein n=1 Tax=Arabis nemorensis TaxID=586526 RepID=A0A565CJF4_9BRAS|nr:unnamed protein product [Arabis nemorensis]
MSPPAYHSVTTVLSLRHHPCITPSPPSQLSSYPRITPSPPSSYRRISRSPHITARRLINPIST